jgi:hypothetical protein
VILASNVFVARGVCLDYSERSMVWPNVRSANPSSKIEKGQTKCGE